MVRPRLVLVMVGIVAGKLERENVQNAGKQFGLGITRRR